MSIVSQLHLPDLNIKGFRGIEDLTVNRLGRVTLLAGKNGVGKTTVLEAIRVYAARGRPSVLTELLNRRDEVSVSTDEVDRIERPDYSALFYGWAVPKAGGISIGSLKVNNQLRIEGSTPTSDQLSLIEKFVPDSIAEDQPRVLKTRYKESEQVLPWLLSDRRAFPPDLRPGRLGSQGDIRSILSKDEPPIEIVCVSIGPGLMGSSGLARFWDAIALTNDENRAVVALQLILGDEVERVAVIGDNTIRSRSVRRSEVRRVVVKLKGQDRPVPLKSLGDGALRLFGVALALANCRNGFLVIDEAENGIHHSIQQEFWSMVLKTAHVNNVQVIATTHSFDCVEGFAKAATESEESEGVLVRIEREDGHLRAVEYNESNMLAAAKQSIEVR